MPNTHPSAIRSVWRRACRRWRPLARLRGTHKTKSRGDGYFNYKPLGAARISGVSEPVDVYELTGLGPMRTHFQLSAERGLSKFVGRQSEIEQLRQALELAKAGARQNVAGGGAAE